GHSDGVTILISSSPALRPSRGTGPASGTPMFVGVVQRSGVLVGVSIWLPMRFCSAWKSVSNFGSPLSSAWSTVIEITPLSMQWPGSKVLLAHTPTWKTHSPFTTPSTSQLGSPSVQRTFFGLVGGSWTGAPSVSRQSVLELPPPPMTSALAAGTAPSNTPAATASDQAPPRMVAGL